MIQQCDLGALRFNCTLCASGPALSPGEERGFSTLLCAVRPYLEHCMQLWAPKRHVEGSACAQGQPFSLSSKVTQGHHHPGKYSRFSSIFHKYLSGHRVSTPNTARHVHMYLYQGVLIPSKLIWHMDMPTHRKGMRPTHSCPLANDEEEPIEPIFLQKMLNWTTVTNILRTGWGPVMPTVQRTVPKFCSNSENRKRPYHTSHLENGVEALTECQETEAWQISREQCVDKTCWLIREQQVAQIWWSFRKQDWQCSWSLNRQQHGTQAWPPLRECVKLSHAHHSENSLEMNCVCHLKNGMATIQSAVCSAGMQITQEAAWGTSMASIQKMAGKEDNYKSQRTERGQLIVREQDSINKVAVVLCRVSGGWSMRVVWGLPFIFCVNATTWL